MGVSKELSLLIIGLNAQAEKGTQIAPDQKGRLQTWVEEEVGGYKNLKEINPVLAKAYNCIFSAQAPKIKR